MKAQISTKEAVNFIFRPSEKGFEQVDVTG